MAHAIDTSGRGARQERPTDTQRAAPGASKASAPMTRRRATLRCRWWLRAERAAMRGRDRYPARGRDAQGRFAAGGSVARRRDRARPPEDEQSAGGPAQLDTFAK